MDEPKKKQSASDVIPGFDEFLTALSKEPFIKELAEEIEKTKRVTK